jgi:hypothetical protein
MESEDFPYNVEPFLFKASGGVPPGMEAGAYTRPFFQLNVSTFCGMFRVASVCQ